MEAAEAIKLTDDIARITEQLKEELAHQQRGKEVYKEIFSLRRSVEQLEQQVREGHIDTLGDAC